MRHSHFAIGLLATLLAAHIALAQGSNYLTDAERLLGKGDLRAAEIQLKNAVRSDPKNMAAHYRLAVVQLQLGDAAAAEREASVARSGGYDPDHTVPLLAETYLAQQKYRQLLDGFPATEGSNAERAGVLVTRGYAQIALGKPEEAHGSFKSAQNLAPDAAGPIIAEAKLLMAERHFEAAGSLFDRALSLDPKSTEARLGKARLLRFDGKADEALARLNELLSDNPGFNLARLEHAEILLSQNNSQAAKADIDAILAVQPGSVPAIYLQAVLNTKNKEYEKANNDLQKISKALPAIPRGYYLKAVVDYNLRHPEQAEDAARRYAARNPNDLAGGKLLGLIELSLGRPAETIDALERFESDGKADPEALDLLGRAYTQLGKTSEALAAFSAAVKLAPSNPTLRTRLGAVQLRAGNTSEAITDLEQSLDLAPSTPATEMLVMTELASGNWERAVEAANKLQQTQANSPVPGNLLGVIQLSRFDLDGARLRFAEEVKKYPEFLPSRLNLARVLELQGKVDEAEATLNDILNKQPANAVAAARLVDLMLREGKADAALSAAERAHDAAPANLGITAGLIDLLIRLGKKDKALSLARQENGSNEKQNLPLIAARARAELAMGLKSEAATTYQRLVDIAPQQIAIRRRLAAVLLDAGDFAGAKQAIDRALDLDPKNPQLAADRIAIDVKASGVDEAIATAKRLQSNYPDLPTATALEGDAYMAAGDHTKAANAYTMALQQRPSAMLAIRLAQAKSAESSAEAGAGILREWLTQHPDDYSVLPILSTLDLAAHRFDDARKDLEKVVEKAPQNAVALNNLAWLYQRAGDPRAMSLAERAYVLMPDLPQTADTLGWILVQQGKAATAIGLLKNASRSNPADPAMRYHLAVALSDTGNKAEAVKLLSELVSGSTNFEEKADAQKLLSQLSKG